MIEPRPELAALPQYLPGRPEGLAQAASFVNLAANENAWGPSPRALEGMSALAVHRYPDMAGLELQASLCDQWQLRAEEVLFGTGSGHLIKCLAEAYVRPHDAVVVVDPTFSLYRSDALLMGGRVEALPGNGHSVDFSALPEFVRRVEPRLVFACSPNNPTGDALDETTFGALVDALPRHALLVVDEAYVHFADNPADALGHVRRGGPVAVLRTFSKAYGLAGFRLGVLLAPAEVVEVVRRVREPFPASSAAMAAAAGALADTDHLDRVRTAVRRGRQRLADGLSTRGFAVHPAQGNFLWAGVPGSTGTELVHALRAEGVLIRDGAGFGVPTHVRITVGTDAELDALFSALDRIRRGAR